MLDWLRRYILKSLPRKSGRGPKSHQKTIVILMDGTMSSDVPGQETNIGLTKVLLDQCDAKNLRVYYVPGLQWTDWRSGLNVLTGKGIEPQIRQAYGVLASWYRPGDTVILMGYSRGAYAVRSLAGVIDMVGLLRHDQATQTLIERAWRYYNTGPEKAGPFRQTHCHSNVPIAAIGVWDTVKALGIRLPFLWRLTEARHAFHHHRMVASTKAAFHALALDERRVAYSPVIWKGRDDWTGTLDQYWFEGTHGEIGGHIRLSPEQRPLSNISLVWMLDRLSEHGLPLPADWTSGIFTNPNLSSKGQQGWFSLLFLARRRRTIRTVPSEKLHESVAPDHWAQDNK